MKRLKTVALATLLMITLQGVEAKELKTESNTSIQSSMVHDPMIKNAIVKIFTVANEPDFREPWSSHVSEFTGSGCIIAGQRILTNAHVVTNGTYVEVLKHGTTKRYEAEVLSIDHEADLALITLKDKSFFDDTKSLDFGNLPELQKEVNVYGFPMGGDTLSITKGVVSRIEQQYYVNSGKSLLAIQIDAAINYGNSGGPALSDGKMVGLVMQGNSYGENMGYIIPLTVINHFLEDMKDKEYNGYPFLGVMSQDLESPVMKEMYGLKDKRYGVLVNKTIPNSPASKVFKTGDILIAIEGHKIFSNHKIEFREKEFVNFEYVLNQHQMGDSIEFTILRDTKEQTVSVKLDKKKNELFLVKQHKPETHPSYFIYGGLVFVPGLREYYVPSKYNDVYPDEKREELVIMRRILSSSLTAGYNFGGLGVIDSINGKKFKNFREFVSLIENSTEKYLLLEDEDHYQMVLNREDIVKSQQEILERYNITYAKSKDLRQESSIKVAKN